MKLCSGRQYKNDISDILGILAAHEESGNPISMEMIDGAVCDLYGSWECIPVIARDFIHSVIQKDNYSGMISGIRESEKEVRDALIEYEVKYPGRVNMSNVDGIVSRLRKIKVKEDKER